ncbi:glucose-1-phosphate adenylyltransferase [Criibacterium bergeronii]|uniref:Glucose-1-phosphate adenylyltransferase n=1 Tax=Criibacterium bergeronii TaxID=1871336 RepID=A0A371IMX7_9FIRM|nr:glucose-1-phosphate adenylyltransferase [Criibacterium bergeronii]MBS6063058.1 glucose-1-phosphate adenylyltransferase [Peptostreptococcaceae bacterium]RDY21831.1 glucose-1-phosphate adenylyltransferase [Criibacterium bergeronii]
MKKKEMLAMILAGGQGSRLKMFTQNLAKPAVPYGGKYRVIDFVISNCANSGLDTVGVLTQYKPFELHNHIGIGASWALNRRDGGAFILPPYMSEKEQNFYKGTAHAIEQNIEFIDLFDPQYLLVLSGDHIYKMNYQKMLDVHKKNNADITIAVIEVPWEEAPRFGIMNTDEDGKIYEFEEKPEHPKSNLASMGIYIFNWQALREEFKNAELEARGKEDFGKDIIPSFLAQDKKLYSYKFSGYWKDVGTLESYWESNMDLLDIDNPLNLFDTSWQIRSHNKSLPPMYISKDAQVVHSMIADGARIKGTVKNSIIFSEVKVEEGAIVEDSVIMGETTIKKDAHVKKAIIGEHVIIGEKVQAYSEDGKLYSIGSNATLDGGEEDV